MQGLWQDFVYAARTTLRAPAFALTVALTLGLGIGVSVAMFSVLDGILLRPLPYRDAGRLVMLWINDPKYNVTEEGFGFPTYEDWRAMNRVFDDVAACLRDNHFLVEYNGQTERVPVNLTTHNVFSLLGVKPEQGRTFTAEEDARGDNVAVISHAYWQRRFGPASPLGESLRIDGRNYEVIGVMPAGFGFPHPETAAWAPWPAEGVLGPLRSIRGGDWLRGVARLKTGVTLAEARQDMDRMATILAEQYPSPDFAGFQANIVPLLQQITGANLPRRLWLLGGAVGFVFLIACINVMSLLVVRNEGRRQELAVRQALGASRGRLARLRLAESLLLSALALGVGVLIASALVPWIVAAAPASTARLDEIRIDWTALACAVGLATLAAMLAASLSGRHRSGGGLAQCSRGSTDAGGARRLQSAFVVVQVALSLVLLCGVGLFTRSLQAALAFDPGFARSRVLLAEVQVPSVTQASSASSAASRSGSNETFFRELFARLQAAPGVSSVGATTQFLIWLNPDHSIVIEGESEPPSQVALMGDSVTPGYFETLGVPLLRGHAFTGDDANRPLALINETMAAHFWPGQDAVGKRFRPGDSTTWYTVIGVVGDMRRQGIETKPIAQMFRAGFTDRMVVAVRGSGDSGALATYLREQVRALDPAAPMPTITTVEQTLEADRAPRRFHTLLLTSFAMVALLLSAIGLFGLQRYTVERRRREIGLRMAVGAQRGDVVRMVVGQGLRLLLIGGAVGLLGSIALADFIQSLLFEVSARDETALIAAALALAAVGMLASYLPARRASQIDPMEALRHE